MTKKRTFKETVQYITELDNSNPLRNIPAGIASPRPVSKFNYANTNQSNTAPDDDSQKPWYEKNWVQDAGDAVLNAMSLAPGGISLLGKLGKGARLALTAKKIGSGKGDASTQTVTAPSTPHLDPVNSRTPESQPQKIPDQAPQKPTAEPEILPPGAPDPWTPKPESQENIPSITKPKNYNDAQATRKPNDNKSIEPIVPRSSKMSKWLGLGLGAGALSSMWPHSSSAPQSSFNGSIRYLSPELSTVGMPTARSQRADAFGITRPRTPGYTRQYEEVQDDSTDSRRSIELAARKKSKSIGRNSAIMTRIIDEENDDERRLATMMTAIRDAQTARVKTKKKAKPASSKTQIDLEPTLVKEPVDSMRF
jgi:hypothetical protein